MPSHFFAATLLALTVVSLPRAAGAQTPDADLMKRLAVHASHFESMRTRASYAIEGYMENVDGDGNANSIKEVKAHIDADGTTAKVTVERYTEDGEDKTDEAKKKARDRERKPATAKPKFRMPVLIEEQPRYVFDLVEVDRIDPSRVRIAFAPKVKEDDTIEGSAWVDTKTGTLLSAGFKLSKTSMFIDHVNVTVEFGAPTALGPAPSRVVVDGEGGVLFFRKHFRGSATISQYRITP
jgi:hypothetical protein